MSKNAGRNSATYKAMRRLFQTGRYPCHICGERPGTTVDHQPPLSTFAHPSQWTGRYYPACSACQSRQGAAITNARHRKQSRSW